MPSLSFGMASGNNEMTSRNGGQPLHNSKKAVNP
jgi:hypothetical protein